MAGVELPSGREMEVDAGPWSDDAYDELPPSPSSSAGDPDWDVAALLRRQAALLSLPHDVEDAQSTPAPDAIKPLDVGAPTSEESPGLAPSTEGQHLKRSEKRKERQRAFFARKVAEKKRQGEERRRLGAEVAPHRASPLHPGSVPFQGGVAEGPVPVPPVGSFGNPGEQRAGSRRQRRHLNRKRPRSQTPGAHVTDDDINHQELRLKLMKRIRRDCEELARLDAARSVSSSATSHRAFNVSGSTSAGSVFSRLGDRSTSGGSRAIFPRVANIKTNPAPVARNSSHHTAAPAPGSYKRIADPRWTPATTSTPTPVPTPVVVRSCVSRTPSWKAKRDRNKDHDHVDIRTEVMQLKEIIDA